MQSKGQFAHGLYVSADRLPIDIVLITLLRTGSFQTALDQIQKCRDKKSICSKNEDDGMTNLHQLAQAPSFGGASGFDIAIADELLKAGVDIKATSKRGYSVIHVAAFHGHVNLAKHYLASGATVDVKDNENYTPVRSLFVGSCQSKTMLLLLLDASQDAASLADSTLIGNRSKAVFDELRAMADPEARMFDTKPSDRKSKDVFIDRLIKDKEEQEARRNKEKTKAKTKPVPDGYTVSSTILIEAVRNGQDRMVNILLSYGADPNKPDEDGRTG